MAVLLAYNFTSDFAPSTTATGVTGSTIVNQSLSVLTRESLGYSTDPHGNCFPPSATIDAAAAITNGSYFTFSITPTSGNSISLTSLTFTMARGGASTPRGYDVRSSADNYAATLGTANLTAQRPTFQTISIDLTGSSFQNVTSTITFRVYIYAPTSANAIDFDDLTLNGTVTVGGGGTVELDGFKWRADDGSETTATYLAAQNKNIIRTTGVNTRLRVMLSSTQDRGAESYRLEYREVGGSTWTVIA